MCRSSFRNWGESKETYPHVGFRLVMYEEEIEEQEIELPSISIRGIPSSAVKLAGHFYQYYPWKKN
jgi:hypothetical protein